MNIARAEATAGLSKQGLGVMPNAKGRMIDVTSYGPSDVDIEAIAAQLSRICRWTGACGWHYSVAQHLCLAHDCVSLWIGSGAILTARPANVKALALLHDAGEFATGDIPRPVRHLAGGLVELENRVTQAVLTRFGIELNDEAWAQVRQADDAVCRGEARELIPGGGEDWDWGDTPPLPVELRFRRWSPETAEAQFLERFIRVLDELRLERQREPGVQLQQAADATSPKAQQHAKSVRNGRAEYATGAVRSDDAEFERYDLISPVGLELVTSWAASLEHDDIDRMFRQTALDLAEDAEAELREAVAGAWSDGHLESAAFYLLAAMHIEEGGSRTPTPAGKGSRPKYGYSRLPHLGVQRLARTCAEGAERYGDHNWLHGMPVCDLLNHAFRHLAKWYAGDRREDHLAHACWNVFAAIHSYHKWPHLNEGTLLGPGMQPPIRQTAA